MQVWGRGLNDESLFSFIFFLIPKKYDYKDLMGYERAFVVNFSKEYKNSRKQQGAETTKSEQLISFSSFYCVSFVFGNSRDVQKKFTRSI